MIQNKSVKKKVEYSVVSAVYNSEGSLKLLRERLDNVFKTSEEEWMKNNACTFHIYKHLKYVLKDPKLQ